MCGGLRGSWIIKPVSDSQSFENLKIRGFRRLANIDFDLKGVNVLIGANGVGKSSFLDALALLAEASNGNLEKTINRMSGLASMITYDRADSIDLSISKLVPGYEPLVYDLTLAPQANAYQIARETLGQKNPIWPVPFLHIDSRGTNIKYFEIVKNNLVQPTWEHNPRETSLFQVPKMFHEPEKFRQKLSSSTFYHVLNVDPRSPVRLPQAMRPAELPGKDGEDLVPCLYYLREAEPDRFEAIEDALKSAFPSFKRLDFPPVAAGTITMTWRDTAFSKPVYPHQFSEGMLRFLWLATLLQSPGLTAITLLDEPEVSLHPELLSLLADLFREASRRTQLVIATHSDRLISFLNPDEVVVMDTTEDGTSTLTRADQLDIDEWLKDYTLDELWRNGRLGARA